MMNERCKELASQAGFQYDSIKDIWYLEGLNPSCNEELKDFALLIVRECIKESMDEIVSEDEILQEKDPLVREYLKGNNQGIVDAVIRFRNHFGVEG